LAKNEIKIVFVHLLEQPQYLLEKIDLIPDLVPTSQIFDSFDDCVVWIKENVEDVYPPKAGLTNEEQLNI